MKWFDELISFPFSDPGDIIHFTQDEYGNILVIDNGDNLILNFDSPFAQSCMSTRYPFRLVHQYTQYMLLVLAFIDPKKVALLGLGGGSLLRTMQYLLPECDYEVVELRQKVVDVAAEYFQVSAVNRTAITVNNALDSIEKWERNSIDIIFSDMYDAYNMDGAQVQQSFLYQCSRLLTARGWLVINLHRLPEDKTLFFEMISAIFPTLYLSEKTHNTIVFASNAHPNSVFLDCVRVQELGRKLGQDFKPLMSNILRKNEFLCSVS